MRLTLRTLLTYLDDILEPQDAKELAEKIEDSEFASGLVHRIRSSVGRVRLSSPQVLGHGVGTDPNSVAEYLDNTLPPDRFPEFERVCLESDTHLSEVASCHQILALVLGEPSHFESSLRQRMYQLPETGRRFAKSETGDFRVATSSQDRAQAGELSPTGAVGMAVSTAVDAGVTEPATTSTVARPADAGSGRSRRLWPIAASLLVGVLAMWGVLLAMGPLDPGHPLAALLGINSTVTEGVFPETPDQPPDDPVVSMPEERYVPPELDNGQIASDSVGPRASEVAPEGLEEPFQPEIAASTPAALDTVAVPADSVVENDRMPLPFEQEPLDPGPRGPLDTWSSEGTVPPPSEGDVERPLASASAAAAEFPAAGVIEPGPGLTNGPVVETSSTDVPIRPSAEGDLARSVTADGSAIGRATEGIEDIEEAPRLQNIGRFISDEEVLAIADEAAGWLRLRPRSSLDVGDQLVALPTYRPKLLLATDLQMTLEGGTSMSVVKPFDGRTLTIQIHHGRAVLIPVGRDTPALGLAFGDRIGAVSFADPESELAIEVRHERLPGSDPQQPAHMVVRMWATSGRVQWKGADDASTKTLEAGQLYLFVDDGPGHFLDAMLPEWAGDQRQSDSMAMASRSLESEMRVERSITLALAEAVEHRRVEVRALAARSLSYFDRFEPLIQSLNDPDQRAWWMYQIDALHEAMARGPDVAARVSQDLAKVRGARGAQLYRLLWGYSPEDLQQGGDGELVDYLDSEELDIRVLGFDNLHRITGAHLMYQPWYPAARRRGSVVKWRKRLAEGLIVYRSPPVIAAELESVR